jgi:hypothetical protein
MDKANPNGAVFTIDDLVYSPKMDIYGIIKGNMTDNGKILPTYLVKFSEVNMKVMAHDDLRFIYRCK